MGMETEERLLLAKTHKERYRIERDADNELKYRVAARHGNLQWCIAFGNDEWAYLLADRVVLNPDGSLVFYGHSAKSDASELLLHAFAPGAWKEFCASNCLDGTPLGIYDDDRIWRKEIALVEKERRDARKKTVDPK
jgi:hypothetical protein